MSRLILVFALTLCLSLKVVQSHAATVPFTEDFTMDVANWADNSGLNLLSHVAAGGPDGGAYASIDTSLAGTSMVLFRAQDEFNSSAHAFEGNWVSDGVGEFSAFVRHDAPVPLTYFARFSSPANFPGATAVKFAPVLSNTWTELEFNIDPGNVEFVTFEGSSFGTIFSNIGHVQLGIQVPEALNGSPTQFTFDVDTASIAARVPEPAGLFAVHVASLGLTACRRRRKP